ncbi:MAG: J domain-containing protein [Cyanobacteria bacterium J06632_22]
MTDSPPQQRTEANPPNTAPKSAPKNHYERLGIQPTASVQQIRRAFRDMSKLYHPDTTELPSAIATVEFQHLNEAYATLSSPEKRFAYDQEIGFSRFYVSQAPKDLDTPVSANKPFTSRHLYIDPTDRPLSAGEIFALFLLGVTFIGCLALVIVISYTKGDITVSFSRTEVVTYIQTQLPHWIDRLKAALPFSF